MHPEREIFDTTQADEMGRKWRKSQNEDEQLHMCNLRPIPYLRLRCGGEIKGALTGGIVTRALCPLYRPILIGPQFGS
jgi:hypothetical protein